MSFEIVNDLPIPPATRSARAKYPFDQMEVGQSFIIPVEALPKKGVTSVRAAVYGYTKSLGAGKKFMLRKMEDESVGVWRVA